MEPPGLRTVLRCVAGAAFLTSIGFIGLFITAESGSWRDPQSWPALLRTVVLTLIALGAYLPIYWLNTHTSGPETSTRRFATLATIFLVGAVLLMAMRAISEPARVANWLWLGATVMIAATATFGIWSQVRQSP